jgi:hypothetical protein
MAIQDFTAGQILTAAQMDALQANDYNQTVSTKTDDYVLVAADKGTRVVMNSATAKTVTVNSGLFAAGDTLFIQNIGVGTCTITAGTCTVTTASSLALGTWAGGTLYFTSASAAIFFSGGGASYGSATGGTSSSITVGGINYTLLTFTATGTLTVTKSGLFDCMTFSAGGGGAGAIGTNGYTGGGGAGAGGYFQQTLYLDANQTITIGAGGAGGPNETWGSRGNVSTVGALLQIVGGAGGLNYSTNILTQVVGACGTGGAGFSNFLPIGLNVYGTSVGYNGGNGVNSFTGGAGGGGGISAVGGNGASTNGGAGGAGYDVSAFIGGSALFKGGGGGGAGPGTGGAGGSSVGGAGASGANNVGGTAAANTASGGGSGTGTSAGGAGGSGIVYIRFKV